MFLNFKKATTDIRNLEKSKGWTKCKIYGLTGGKINLREWVI
jgi:hypothetical protein